MCATTPQGNTTEEKLPGGLYAGHAYSVMSADTVTYEKNGVVMKDNVVQIRNPWGRGEWIGKWGDNSTLWSESEKKRLGVVSKNDGIFYMNMDEFSENFESAGICMVQDRAFYNAVPIPAFDKSTVRFTIKVPGEYAFSINQKDLKYFPVTERGTRRITYTSARLTVGKLLPSGDIEFVAHKIKKNQNVFAVRDCQPGEYVALIEVYYKSIRLDYNFSTYGPELLPLKLVELSF